MAVMRNMDPKKCPMPSQEPNVRNKNFNEVALGYTYEMAVNEAKRCLNCPKKPCRSACPVQIDIPAFIERVANEDMEGAYKVLTASSALPAVCGRVCPQETQCEGKCVRGIKGEPVGIGRLERFVADWHREHVDGSSRSAGSERPQGRRHRRRSVRPDLPLATWRSWAIRSRFTKPCIWPAACLSTAFQSSVCPKAIVQKEIDGLKAMGVDIETNMVIGKVLTIDELFEMGFEAVFVGSGAGLPRFMGIPGESLKGVYSANEYLTRINLMKAYQRGQQNPDQAQRQGRRGRRRQRRDGRGALRPSVSARKRFTSSIAAAWKSFRPVRKKWSMPRKRASSSRPSPIPLRCSGNENGEVCGMRCVEMELGEPDASGRRRPIVKEGSEFVLDVDTMIMSIGTSPNPLIRHTTPGLETNKHGCIITNGDDGLTSREGVYAGGDAVTGAATVILAMGAGKHAAKAIDEYIKSKNA